MGELSIRNSSTANVSGGSFNGIDLNSAGTAIVSGGNIGSLFTNNTSVLDLIGSGLTETYTDVSRQYNEYTVMGILQNGDRLDTTYTDFGGTLLFNGQNASPVPESSSVISLGLLLMLGLGGLALTRARHVLSLRKNS